MILKKIKLVTHHTSWWKRKKYRKEAYETLRNYKSKGWKVKKVVKLKKKIKTQLIQELLKFI